MNNTLCAARAYLYEALAEALAEPAAWLTRAGDQWPLTKAALQVAQDEGNEAIFRIVSELVSIPAESLRRRKERYDSLLTTGESASIGFYESLAREDHLAGSYMHAVWSAYRAAGLEVANTELPDHVSVELAFLAYLAQQQSSLPHEAGQWHRARRLFVKRHVSQWMPVLGDALAATEDVVYAPIGRLLATSVRSELRPRTHHTTNRVHRLPVLIQPDTCNLCSFCVHVCPTQALTMRESDTITALLLDDTKCTACRRCVDVCSTHALELETIPPETGYRLLFQSPRLRCPACGQPTISQAEFDAVAERIGQPAWLDYCLDCRASLLEETR